MAINSKSISTFESVKKSLTSDWQNNTTSNNKKSLKDRKSPLKDFLTVEENDLTNKTNLIESKIDKTTFTELTKGLKDSVDLKDMKIDPQATDKMRNNLIASISSSLESPGMPLNAKTDLRKAIDAVCSKNVNLGLNSSLKDLLNMLAIGDLMSLIECLSNPIKLAQVTASLLTSSLGDKTLTKGLNSAIASKNIDVGAVKDMLKTDTGKRLLNESKNTLLPNLDKNVKSDKSGDTDLLSILPKDADSMCMYDDNGLFTVTAENVAKDRSPQPLSNTGDGTVDADTSLWVKAKTFLKETDYTTL